MAPLIPGPTTSDIPSESVTLQTTSTELETIHVGPLKMTVLEDGHRTDNRLGIVRISVPPHMPGPAQHWHQMHDESFFVVRGAAVFTSRDRRLVARAGDTLIVPPCAPHTFANETDEVCEMTCTFTPAYYVNYFRLMAEMAARKHGAVDHAVARRAMLQYATIETGEGSGWIDGSVEPGKDLRNFV